MEGLRRGHLTASVMCWKEGMPDWRPLAEVEPFAGELARQEAAARKRATRIAIAVVVPVCLVGAGVAAYFVVMGPPEVRQARKLISAGFYGEAHEALKPYVARKPLDNRARYLLGIAQVNDYASADTTDGIGLSFMRIATSLEEAKQNLSRVLSAKPGWIDKARADLAAAAARIPPGTMDGLSRSLAVARLRAELKLAKKQVLAGELMGRVTSSVDSSGQGVLRNDDVVLQILEWDPSLSSKLVEAAVAGASGSEQELRMMLPTLERWASDRPALAKPVASELLSKTESLYREGRHAEAKTVLSKALAIDPKAATTQEQAFLCVKLTDPDDAKLIRCQYFLKEWSQSSYVAEVLMVMVKDAVTMFDHVGEWQRAKAEPYLLAGLEAAKRLLKEYPATAELDVELLELAKRLAEDKKTNDAIGLMSQVSVVMPDSPIKIQIATAIAQWREAVGKGPLPQEFDASTEDVEKNLKIMDLTTPAAIRILMENPTSAQVVRVDDNCTVDKFTIDAINMLKSWVRNGGILWVNNDVLSRFGIRYGQDLVISECSAAVGPEVCPILTGISNVVVAKDWPAAFNVSCPGVIPLLVGGRGNDRRAYWSLAPYGKGLVSDVKDVDVGKYDGARFWLNFRLFCLGRQIPGAPEPQPSAPKLEPNIPEEPQPQEPVQPPIPTSTPSTASPQPDRITDPNELEKVLETGTSENVIWVAFTRDKLGVETRRKLRSWLAGGRVLWVETDLAESFGFGGLSRVNSYPLQGRVRVAQANHPVVFSLVGKTVRYELDPNGFVFRATAATLQQKKIVPLLVETNRPTEQVPIVCALYEYEGGAVILRPKNLDSADGSKSFEEALLSFSLDYTGSEEPEKAPSRGRLRSPVIRRRSRSPSQQSGSYQ
jgi:tetratricopeptide (TPR) repeat protein